MFKFWTPDFALKFCLVGTIINVFFALLARYALELPVEFSHVFLAASLCFVGGIMGNVFIIYLRDKEHK